MIGLVIGSVRSDECFFRELVFCAVGFEFLFEEVGTGLLCFEL